MLDFKKNFFFVHCIMCIISVKQNVYVCEIFSRNVQLERGI